MFQTAPGVVIPFPERIAEEYQLLEGGAICANISYEHLRAVVDEFYRALPEPLFFVLQLPLTRQEELQLGDGGVLHQEVLYLDGQTQAQIDAIMKDYGQLLLGDGMSQFAIASHQNDDEIFVQKYKIVTIYSKTPEKYSPILEKYGLRKTDDIATVWSTFSHSSPGECHKISVDGLDAYAVADILKTRGMYRAKVIDE